MFEIKTLGSGALRLVSADTIGAEEFAAVARAAQAIPFTARKIGFVAARMALQHEVVETRWNGAESQNTAEPNDYIVTNMSEKREILTDREGRANVYVIKANRFPELYEATTEDSRVGRIFRAKGSVTAIFLAGGFDIKAPWGEQQRSETGYLLCNGREVYGNAKGTFEATYETIPQPFR